MGFRFTSFLGGAAEGASKAIEDEEKNAKQFGILAAKDMLERFDKIKEENDLEIAKKVDIIKTLRSYNPNFTESQLKDIVSDTAAVNTIEQLAKTGKLNQADWKSFVKGDVIPEQAGDFTAEELVKKELALPTGEGLKTQYKERTGFMGVFGESTYEKTIEQAAQAKGVTKEQLLAARGYKKPELQAGKSQFDFDALTPITAETRLSLAKSAYAKALDGNDQEKINVTRDAVFKAQRVIDLGGDPSNILNNSSTQLAYAQQALLTDPENPQLIERKNKAVTERAIALRAVSGATIDKAKTFDQQKAALINQIMDLEKEDPIKNKDQITVLKAELEERQRLFSGGGDAAVKAGQLTTAAKGNFNATMASSLETGSYSIDPASGMVIPSGNANAAKATQATITAYKYMISEYTVKDGPNKGEILSEAHRSALLSIGIQFNGNIPIIPSFVLEKASGQTARESSLPAVAAGAPPTRQPSPPGMQIPPEVQKARDAKSLEIKQKELTDFKKALTETTDPKDKKALEEIILSVTREITRMGGKVEEASPVAAKPSLGTPAPASQPKKQEPEKMPVNRDGSAYIGGMKKNVPYVDKEGRVSYIDDNGKRQFIR
jgi:hypothetical protein